MKKNTRHLNGAKTAIFFLAQLFFIATISAQPSLFIRTGDFNGDAKQDELWSGGTPGSPYLYIKHGGTGTWKGYFVGPTYSVANTGIDLDGIAGLEIAFWHPTSESMVIITDKTGATKGYYLGSTGLNSWVQCFNSWTNLDGLAGAEIKVNYYTRCNVCQKGFMIIHRNKTTKGTLTCASTSRQIPGADAEDGPEVPEPANVNDGVGTSYPEGYFENQENYAGLTLSPNPAQNTLTIEVSTTGEAISRISVSDATGKPVLNVTQNTRTLDISKLNPGFYMIRVETNKRLYTGKFIKK